MKAIVTGGAGFLGSHLCDKLIDEGHDVLCIDSLLTGSLKNIEHLKNNSRFEFLNADVTEEFKQEMDAGLIFHLASPASPNKHSPLSYLAFPEKTMAVNTLGTTQMADLAVKCKARFLFASTSEVYGDPLENPQKESYRGNVSTTGPRAVYDESKRFGETIVSAFIRKYGLDARIIRIFNTYGPRMADDGRVVTEFIKAALKNEPFPVFGEGNQTRSFCFVSDMIEGVYSAMVSDEAEGEVINLGNPDEITILQLAETIKNITHSSSEIYFKEPLPEDDPMKRHPDIAKARKILNWEPKVALDKGLKEYIKSMKENNFS